MDVTLKVIEGAKAGAAITVKKAEFVIGRSQECHLCAASSAISRQHCALIRGESSVTVKDLGSRNGTLVNGAKIDGEVELKSGDELSVGPLKFLVTITAGIANGKRPEVKSVAEAVARVAEKSPGDIGDEDISRWLLTPAPISQGFSETQTIRMDETHAAKFAAPAAEADAETAAIDAAEAADSDARKSGPGKLPKVPAKPSSKDSREAASEALRAWSRRR